MKNFVSRGALARTERAHPRPEVDHPRPEKDHPRPERVHPRFEKANLRFKMDLPGLKFHMDFHQRVLRLILNI